VVPILLILVLTLGAVGLFLALPAGPTRTDRVGWLVLAGAGAVLLGSLLQLTPGPAPGWFAGLALIAVFSAVRVITHRRPVYSALYFVLLILTVTALLVLMEAPFLSVALVIVYAGAILVTYVFVIMLARQARPTSYDTRARDPFWGCLAGFLLLLLLSGQLNLFQAGPPRLPAVADSAPAGTVEQIAVPLFTDYLLAVQLIGLLLLAALAGAIAIARRQPTGIGENRGEA